MGLENGGNDLVMPVAPMYGGSNGGGFGFGGDWGSLIVLFLICAMFGGFGGNGFGGGFGGNSDFPWLMSGQQGINENTNGGFRDQMLQNGITSVRDGLGDISTQLCNGFAGVEQGANARQMASMNQNFALQSALANCCCENRLGIADLKYTVATENCADRQALNEGVRDIIASQTAGTQRILDQLCADKIDAKNDEIAQLRQELLYARGQASQDVQTAIIRQGQNDEIDALYNRLNNCPVGTVPVYGKQPIFSCQNNGCNCGCGM